MSHDENRNGELQPAALTRREWLLSVGSAVVLSGFRGKPGPAAQVAATSLPPGLYAPSLEHLTHALGSDGPFVAIPPGAETEYVGPHTGAFVPQAFSQEEFAAVKRLVEIILGEDLGRSPEKPVQGAPATIFDEASEWIDLVVASAAKVRALARSLPEEQRALAVAYFGSEEPVRELETFEPERVCRDGLAWLDGESRRRFAKRFVDANAGDQTGLVHAASDTRPDMSVIHAGTRLFDFLKAECIRGFYTSRVGLKELDYKGNAFYGESPGCGLTAQAQSTKVEGEKKRK
jgi:gluconate 2-dehydrogenase subunit 3-like protein